MLSAYSKTPLNAALLNAVLALRGSTKAVHYIATVYTMCLFQRSFVRLSRIKIPTVFSEGAITVRTQLSCVTVDLLVISLTLFRLALELIGTYPRIVKRGLTVFSSELYTIGLTFLQHSFDSSLKKTITRFIKIALFRQIISLLGSNGTRA